MDPMHDAVATKFSFKDNTLIVEYNNLDQGMAWRNTLTSENKKVTIEYEFDSFCEAKFFKKNKVKFVDLPDETDIFYKLTNNIKCTSLKYSVDSFNTLTLFFNIYEKHKYWNFEITMDATKSTYIITPLA